MTTKEIIDVSNLTFNARELEREHQSSAQYVQLLQEQAFYKDAILFHAHEREIRPVIEWATACVRELQPTVKQPEGKDSLQAVEQWLKVSDDSTRWVSRETADRSGMSVPADCLAMAIFFSGGSISPPGATNTPPPAFAANKLAAASITLAVLSQMPEHAAKRYQRALALLDSHSGLLP